MARARVDYLLIFIIFHWKIEYSSSEAVVYGLNDIHNLNNEYLVTLKSNTISDKQIFRTFLLGLADKHSIFDGEIQILETVSFNDFISFHILTKNYTSVEKLQHHELVDFIETNKVVTLIKPIQFGTHYNEVVHFSEFKQISSRNTQAGKGNLSQSNTTSSALAYCQEQKTGSELWGLSRLSYVDKPPSNAVYRHAAYNCDKVFVYVIDTGIYTRHDEFEGRAAKGYTSISIIGDSSDDNGHGTHVAGIVGGATVGVSKDVNLISVKVLDEEGRGSESNVVAGVNWVCNDVKSRKRRKSIANLSLGSDTPMMMLEKAIKECQAGTGLIFVVAAGNDAADACLYSPSSMPSVISVGSTDITDDMSPFSNYGRCVDILAPGRDIWSAYYRHPQYYLKLSGTSMAAPFVSGAIAQYISYYNGSYSQRTVLDWLTSASSKNKIRLPTQATGSTPNRLLYSSCDNADLYCNGSHVPEAPMIIIMWLLSLQLVDRTVLLRI